MADEEISGALANCFPAFQQAYTQSQPILNEWTNHSAFYAVYPSYYYTFANQWLRKWLAWFDGYVPGIHDGVSGILSTRLATTLCNRLGEQVFGDGLLFANDKTFPDAKKSLDFISRLWKEDGDWDNQILKTFILASAGGTSYIKSNISADREYWIDSWRADQCWTDVDFRGRVNRAKFIVAKYTKTVPSDKGKQEDNCYLIEERFFANPHDCKEYKKKFKDQISNFQVAPSLERGKPYTRYQVFRLTGVASDFAQGVNLGSPLNWEEIPDDFKKSIIEDYGTLKVNLPQRLPFLDLGVDMFKWTAFISNLPQLPYGESVVAKIQAYLYEYDFMNSCMNTDFYLGRGRVMVPKSLQSPKPINFAGNMPTGNYNQGLDSFIFTKVDYASTEDKKPEPIQFDLRSQDWLTARNHLIENIATSIGISPSTLASYLQDSSARTAREISSEESATALFVTNRRKLFTKPINDLVRRILLFNGLPDTVTVKFSQSGQTNTTLVTENVTSAYNARLISQYLAVKKLNPDMSEDEIQEEIERINADQEKIRQQNEDYLGGGSLFNDSVGAFGTEEGNDDFKGANSEERRAQLASDNT